MPPHWTVSDIARPPMDTRNPWGRRSWTPRLLLVLAVLVAAYFLINRDVTQMRSQIAAWIMPDTPTQQQTRHSVAAAPEKPSPAKKQTTSAASEPAPPQPAVTTVDYQPTLAQWCEQLAGRLFSVSLRHCSGRGFVDTGYRSVEGRMIALLDMPAKRQPSLGRVLLVGGTHGDELTSVSLSFWWLELIDATPRQIDWRIVPAMNPDGVLAEPARRLNANNVDLNRNLPTPGWRAASREYWRDVGHAPRRYPGENPASEPETRWLMSEVANYKPDVIVALHAPYGVLDYDGNFPPPPRIGELALQRLGVFPGSLGNYGSRYLGIPVITVELDHATRMPSRQQAQDMLDDLETWLRRYLGQSQQVEITTPPANG